MKQTFVHQLPTWGGSRRSYSGGAEREERIWGALYKVGTAVFILFSPCEETQQDVPCSEGRGSLQLGFALCDQHYFSLHLKWWCLGPYGWEVNCRQYQRPQGCQLPLLNKATRRRCHHCKKDSPLVMTAHHTTWCRVHSADSYRFYWSEQNLFTFLWICEGNSQNLYKPNPYPKMVESRISFSKEGSTQGEVPSLGNLQIF